MIWLLWLLHGWIVDGPPVPSIDKFGGVADGKKRNEDDKILNITMPIFFFASDWYGIVNGEDILSCV